MPPLQGSKLVIALAVFFVLAESAGIVVAEQDDHWKLNPGPGRLAADPGLLCAAEGERLYGIPAKDFKTVSVQIAAEGKKLVRLSIGKEWYACTLDRLHGLVDFRGG